MSFLSFPSHHSDYIHDIAYDWYGKRLATCSSDQVIKIWDQQQAEKSNSTGSGDGSTSSSPYVCTGVIRGHSGSIHRLSWAHPEFGCLLASCSTDRAVHVFEEQKERSNTQQQQSGGSSSISQRVHSRRSPSPSAGVGSAAPIGQWKRVGRLVDSRGSVVDVEFAPPHLGLKLATCSLDGVIRVYTSPDLMNLSVWNIFEEFEASKRDCFSLSWNPHPFDPAMMAIAAQNTATVWEQNDKLGGKWAMCCTLEGHTDLVHDVAWAPNVGRSYHLIATACKDAAVRVFTLSYHAQKQAWVSECVATLKQHEAQVWRVKWNISGTILASSGDEGQTRLWKADYNGQWHQILQCQC